MGNHRDVPKLGADARDLAVRQAYRVGEGHHGGCTRSSRQGRLATLEDGPVSSGRVEVALAPILHRAAAREGGVNHPPY